MEAARRTGQEARQEMERVVRTSTGRMRAWLRAGVVSTTAAALLLAGCSRGDDGEEAVSSPTATATEPAPSPPAPAPEGPATPSGDTGTAPQRLPFPADTNPDVSTVQEGYPVLVSVTQGDHAGYRRYVFTFEHLDPQGRQPWREHARPRWDVRYVPASEAVMEGSGEPVANSGARAHLRIRYDADMHDSEGRSTLQRSVGDDTLELVFGGDFENRVTWFYGADKKQPFRVFYVGEGRVAVDVVR